MKLRSVKLGEEEFVWDGERWYNRRTFQAPRPSQEIELRKELAKEEESKNGQVVEFAAQASA